MCKLLIGLQLHESEEFQRIVKHETLEIATQRDGLGVLLVNQKNDVSTIRHNTDYEGVLGKLAPKMLSLKLIGVHGRLASTGAVNMENVHFFKEGNYIMAHNGFVTAYSGYGRFSGTHFFNQGNKEEEEEDDPETKKRKEKFKYKKIDIGDWEEMEAEHATLDEVYYQCKICLYDHPCVNHKVEMARNKYLEGKLKKIEEAWERIEEKYNKKEKVCDSRMFLRSLPPEGLTAEILEAFIETKTFSGVAVILDVSTNEVFLFSTRDIKVQTDFKDYILFYSYSPTTSLTETEDFLGLSFNKSSTRIQTFDLEKGIYQFSYAQEMPEILTPLEKEKSLVIA